MTDENLEQRFGLLDLARPVCWAILTATETTAELARLEHWVTWLQDRYHVDQRTVPGCWDRHSDLVEELSALRTAWVYSFNGGARPDAALTWHAALHATRSRLRDIVAETGCRPGQHRGPSPGK